MFGSPCLSKKLYGFEIRHGYSFKTLYHFYDNPGPFSCVDSSTSGFTFLEREIQSSAELPGVVLKVGSDSDDGRC